MKESLLHLFEQYQQYAILISLLISILIAVSGILPSFFITAANILFFGFWNGLLISFLGEAIGAIIAFVIYRKGFRKSIAHQMEKYPKVQRLLDAENREAFLLILSLRLIPFVPSGLITFAAAIGRVSAGIFILSSSLGKIPALLLEGYSAYELTRFGWQGKIILALIAIFIIYWVIKRMTSRKN